MSREPWNVRAPYAIVSTLAEAVGGDRNSSVHSTSTPGHSEPESPAGPQRKLRPVRQTPRCLDNFVSPLGPGSDRLFNTRSKIYFLPSDETEFERLEHQHTAFTVGFGGLYPCPEVVREVLSPEQGKPKSILDLGCGSGVWAVEMAREFPHATVWGVDLIPCPAQDVPPNCHFEIDDCTAGLEHFAEKFDLVHVRCVSFGIANYRKFIEDVSRCLKPGGLSIFIDGDTELLAEDKQTVLPMALSSAERRSGKNADRPATEEGSWLQRILFEATNAARLHGSDMPEAGEAIDEGLWRINLYDSDTCGASSFFVPVGPWPRSRDYEESQQLQYAGSLIRQDCLVLIRAFHSLFLQHGISQSILDQWTAAIDYELSSQKFRAWARLRIAWGRRKLDNNQPITPSSSPIPEHHDTTIPLHLRHMEIYSSSEQSLMAKAARKLTRGSLPVPFVIQVQKGITISM